MFQVHMSQKESFREHPAEHVLGNGLSGANSAKYLGRSQLVEMEFVPRIMCLQEYGLPVM